MILKRMEPSGFAKSGKGHEYAPLVEGARIGETSSACYFFAAISAGKYREISKPAATWHMAGFFQFFFMILLLYQPAEAAPLVRFSFMAGTSPSQLRTMLTLHVLIRD
jgi:hypothetical protein